MKHRSKHGVEQKFTCGGAGVRRHRHGWRCSGSSVDPCVIRRCPGQIQGVEERSSAAPFQPHADRGAGEPEVTCALEDGVARLSLAGELTGVTRRPLMRVLTDLLLQVPSLHRVELDLHAVSFMNSAGMAVLVQALRMTAPRGIELLLVGPPPVVVRPLQLSGLWHRFPMRDEPPPGAVGD